VTMGAPDELEAAIDDLYARSPEEFTAARDALAGDRTGTGDDQGAKRVRALRKPVRSAWAVNRLVREDRDGVQELIALGERLRAAQRRALSGGGADELRERSEDRRKLVGALTQRAAKLLGDADPPAAAVEDIGATLEAASIDEAAAAAVLEGRLTKPLPRPAGFGDVVGLKTIPGGKQAETPGPSAAEERAEQRRHERELKTAEDREQRSRALVERLRAELERLQASTAKKKEELRAAEAEARGAAVDLRRLRR
jgi:hypothetical protein